MRRQFVVSSPRDLPNLNMLSPAHLDRRSTSAAATRVFKVSLNARQKLAGLA